MVRTTTSHTLHTTIHIPDHVHVHVHVHVSVNVKGRDRDMPFCLASLFLVGRSVFIQTCLLWFPFHRLTTLLVSHFLLLDTVMVEDRVREWMRRHRRSRAKE